MLTSCSLFTRTTIVLALFFLLSCSTQKADPPKPILPVPSDAQLAWAEMETNAFIHFTINTFTDKEWGYGDESPVNFNPSSLDVNQWISTLKNAGFGGVILTCKHHDGFCLWPTAYTEHSIKASPYKNGKGDIVKEVSETCKKNGLKFGVYLSPWDRNHAKYGTQEYITYYRNQLNELFTSYGPIFEMWFDGANGGDGYYGGAREMRTINGSTYYDWPTTLDLVRKMEPNVIFFSDAGPGVRWVGNERGEAGETNWNTITPDTLFAGKSGIEKLLQTGNENGSDWIPAEVDVSIRPGWFYHAKEDSLVKTPERLFQIYLSSVGRGSTLLLNVPPDKRGLFHENDVKNLLAWRQMINDTFKEDFAKNASIGADSYRGGDETYGAGKAIDGDNKTYWATDDNVLTGALTIDFKSEKKIKYVVLQEYIRFGQRVKRFTIDAFVNGAWSRIGEGTTIGYKRILPVTPSSASKLKVTIEDAKACPLISTVAIY